VVLTKGARLPRGGVNEFTGDVRPYALYTMESLSDKFVNKNYCHRICDLTAAMDNETIAFELCHHKTFFVSYTVASENLLES